MLALFDEADERAPGRSTRSDGTIGNADHQARSSGHNPDASGDVLAGDLTDDPDDGCDVRPLVAGIVARRDHRVRVLIHDRVIWRSYPRPARGNRPDLAAWQPEVYTGPNQHKTHAHVEVHDTPAAKTDTSSWFPTTEDDDMLHRPELIVAPLDEHGQYLVNTTSGLVSLIEKAAPTSEHLRAVGVPAIQMDAASWANLKRAMAKVRHSV